MRATIRDIQDMKRRGEKIPMVTAYDYPGAMMADRAGVDMILVGDSVANVVLGYETTNEVTLDDMIHHTAAVSPPAATAPQTCPAPPKISHAESRPNRSPAPSPAKPSNTKRCKGMIWTNSDCSTPTPYQPMEAFFIV